LNKRTKATNLKIANLISINIVINSMDIKIKIKFKSYKNKTLNTKKINSNSKSFEIIKKIKIYKKNIIYYFKKWGLE
jgi:hypothetical protein